MPNTPEPPDNPIYQQRARESLEPQEEESILCARCTAGLIQFLAGPTSEEEESYAAMDAMAELTRG